MHRIFVLFALCLTIASAQDTLVEAPIKRLGLFKNGIGLVERTINLPSDGTYYLAPGPEPLHGTVWVQSDAQVGVRRGIKMLPVPRTKATDPLYEPLIGKEVGLTFRSEPATVVYGTIEGLLPSTPDVLTDPFDRPWNPSHFLQRGNTARQQLIIFRSEGERFYIQPGDVYMLRERNPEPLDNYTVEHDLPVLEISATNVPAAGGSVTLTYLAKGITWAPSYRLQLGDAKTFRIEQAALVMNELEAFEEAAVELISGYPAIMYANTVSPLAPQATLQQFFQEVTAQARSRMDSRSNAAAITNQMVSFGGGGGFGGVGAFGSGGAAGGGGQMAPQPVPEALTAGDADLHYHPIGNVSSTHGEVHNFSLGEESGEYRNVLLWTESSQWQNQNWSSQDDDPRLQYPGLWDAVVLENPFDRPLTTGPCYMELDGRFLAQTVLYWTAQGNEATLPLNKALGLPATVEEEQIRLFEEGRFGRLMQEIKVTMTLVNPRSDPQEVHIQYRFPARSVALPDDGNAQTRILNPEGLNDINLVTATVTAPAEETTTFEFTYTRVQ